MIDIHVYGFLKKKFDPNARLSERTIIKLEHVEQETFSELLTRLQINTDELGDCFLNGIVILDGDSPLIPDSARVGLFSFGMQLHEGGHYLKFRSVYES